MNFKLVGMLGLVGLMIAGAGQTRQLCDGLVEKNDLNIPVGSKDAGGMTQDEFNKILDRVETKYKATVAAHGGNLVMERAWDDGTVNAYANQSGGDWIVHMYGGLARHPAITGDGLMLAACHELGHHLGGAPKINNYFSSWASNEGQADYFANLKCFRQIVENDNNEAIVNGLNVPDAVKKGCTQQYSDYKAQLVCEREAMAGFSVAKLFQVLRKEGTEPGFTTPDANIVTEMFDAHPGTQCRLDTYYNGALCNAPYATDVSNTDVMQGTCEHQDFQPGGRPRCWFKF